MSAPDCTACQFQRPLPGTHHRACAHPVARAGATLALFHVHMTGGLHVVANRAGEPEPVTLFKLRVDQHGLDHGWADWPAQFDPIWIRECSGFQAPIPSPTAEGADAA